MTQTQNAAHPAGRSAGRAQVQSTRQATNHEKYSSLSDVESALTWWPTEALGHLLGNFDTDGAEFYCPTCQPPRRQIFHAPAAHAVGQHRWECTLCRSTGHRRYIADIIRERDDAFERLLAALAVPA